MKPDPVILAFDSSAAHCAAALLLGDTVHTRVENMARGQGERLMGLLDELLTAHHTAWADLTALGVGVGPGNFTGIRISVAAARGAALGLGIPAVGVSTFETTRYLGDLAQVAVPAPRDHVYYLDPDKMTAPILTGHDTVTSPHHLSSDFPQEAHIAALTRIAAQRAGPDTPRPAPLYVRPADAAPPREQPPVILP